ncbi:hypothetical protein BKA80DRAFT_303531 [Phyllosticta citrichinensis]
MEPPQPTPTSKNSGRRNKRQTPGDRRELTEGLREPKNERERVFLQNWKAQQQQKLVEAAQQNPAPVSPPNDFAEAMEAAAQPDEVDSLGSPPAKRPRIEDFEDLEDYVVEDARPSELAKTESLEKVVRTSGADIDTTQSALVANMMLMLLAHFKKLVAKGEDHASIQVGEASLPAGHAMTLCARPDHNSNQDAWLHWETIDILVKAQFRRLGDSTTTLLFCDDLATLYGYQDFTTQQVISQGQMGLIEVFDSLPAGTGCSDAYSFASFLVKIMVKSPPASSPVLIRRPGNIDGLRAPPRTTAVAEVFETKGQAPVEMLTQPIADKYMAPAESVSQISTVVYDDLMKAATKKNRRQTNFPNLITPEEHSDEPHPSNHRKNLSTRRLPIV